METAQSAEEIRRVAKDLDDALESKNVQQILSFFSEDCEIELLGMKLTGKNGARRWIDWQFKHIAEVKLIPVKIMVEADMFFEEFVVRAKLRDGTEVESKQAEVLVYEDYKVKSLRLYFDRLGFADSVAKGFVSKAIVRALVRKSVAGPK